MVLRQYAKKVEPRKSSTATQLRQVNNYSAMENVYMQLKHSVMAGNFSPGQPMRLENLASAFGTSHTPVREALNRLVVAGALESEPRKSLRIPRMTVQHIENLKSVRLVNEGQAASWAAERCTDSDIKQLKIYNLALDDELKKQNFNISKYLDINRSFHFHLYSMANNDVLMGAIETLWLQAGPLLNLLKEESGLLSGHDHHKTVIAGLEQNNGDMTRNALQNDINEAYEVIVDIVKRQINK